MDWTQYDQLKAQGLADREIARQWGIPWGTFCRAKQQRSRIAVPVQRPVQSLDTGAVHSVDTGAVQRLDRLEDEVQGLRQLVQAMIERLDHPPVQRPVQITALPPMPPSKATRWNLWLPALLQEEISRIATARGISPSQLVKEWLWEKLQAHQSSTP